MQEVCNVRVSTLGLMALSTEDGSDSAEWKVQIFAETLHL